MPEPCKPEMEAYKQALGDYLDAAGEAGAAFRTYRALVVAEAACVAGIGSTAGLLTFIVGGACVELFFEMEQAGDDLLIARENKDHAFFALEDADGTLRVCLGNHKRDSRPGDTDNDDGGGDDGDDGDDE
jgi:hypothetical protein